MANDKPGKAAKPAAAKPPKEPQPIHKLTASRQLLALRFSRCGKLLAASGADGSVRRWRFENGKFEELNPLDGHRGWVPTLAFCQDRLASADTWGRLCGWSYLDTEVKPAWSVEDAHDGWIRQLAASPDGTQLASCGADGRICLWSATDGKRLAAWQEPGADFYSLAFHPDGRSLVSGDLYGVIKQRDAANGKVQRELDARVLHLYSRIQDVGGVRRLVFDPSGKTLAAAGMQPSSGGFVQGSPTVRLFDFDSGKATETIKLGGDPDGFVHDLRFQPAGHWIGVTSGQPGRGSLFFWRAGQEKPFYTSSKFPNCHTFDLHPELPLLAVAATAAGSGGNGRKSKSDADYQGSTAPISVWDLTTLPAS